jgi:hypothetical protein
MVARYRGSQHRIDRRPTSMVGSRRTSPSTLWVNDQVDVNDQERHVEGL